MNTGESEEENGQRGLINLTSIYSKSKGHWILDDAKCLVWVSEDDDDHILTTINSGPFDPVGFYEMCFFN